MPSSFPRRAISALVISFDYGSNHNGKEIPFAQLHCKRLGIPHVIIPLDFMGKYFKSSLLEGADAIPEGHYDDDNMKSTVVPFRNGIMLSIAVGVAESHSLAELCDCWSDLVAKFKATISSNEAML